MHGQSPVAPSKIYSLSPAATTSVVPAAAAAAAIPSTAAIVPSSSAAAAVTPAPAIIPPSASVVASPASLVAAAAASSRSRAGRPGAGGRGALYGDRSLRGDPYAYGAAPLLDNNNGTWALRAFFAPTTPQVRRDVLSAWGTKR